MSKESLEAPKVIFVIGATATGKSGLALEWAEKYQGSIVNIDSVQFYKNVEIGSASPTEAEKKRVPHYLYNYVQAPNEMTAGQYIRDFYELVEKKPESPLFIVGGTGFYIQALEKGMYDIEPIPEEFRKKIEIELIERGAESLWMELKKADPESLIHINDHYRLVRAIEVLRYFGKTMNELKADSESHKNKLPFSYLKLGVKKEKSELQQSVQRRTEKMIQQGLVDEVKRLLQAGLKQWAPLSSVGYKETVQMIEENQNEKWLAEQVVQSTMRLIKKQNTWFQRDHSVLWSHHETSLGEFLKLS